MSVVETGRRSGLQAAIRTPPTWIRLLLAYLLLVLIWAGVERGSFALAQVPVSLNLSPASLTIIVDGSRLQLPLASAPTTVMFPAGDPTYREFQLDGSDTANNFSEDPAYIASVQHSPYYRFQAWMRDFGTYSSWQAISVHVAGSTTLLSVTGTQGGPRSIALPLGHAATVSARVSRLEVPARVVFLQGETPCAEVVLDRNNRQVVARQLLADGTPGLGTEAYLPRQPIPFLADVVNLIAHVALWSLALLAVVALLHALLLVGFESFVRTQPVRTSGVGPDTPMASKTRKQVAIDRVIDHLHLGDRWNLVAALTLIASLSFTIYVSLVEFAAVPHILDASAYYFQAKIFASGRLSVPVPSDLPAFQGPFMVAYDGRWFSQYAPGTSAVLALGMLAHTPWLVEPGLGTLALLGIYRIGRMLFSPAEALLALLLGALSPFYSYLAASYLSHAVALFFCVYFIFYLVRFEHSYAIRDAVLAGAALGGVVLTRELDAAVLGITAPTFVLILGWRHFRTDLRRLVVATAAAAAILVLAMCVYLLYDWLQTGNPFVLPRALFSAADRYGFGVGVGFYGEHTLAAGLVNLDQQLTILLIDLYGWPFYLTLTLVPLAFLRRLRALRWDLFCLTLSVVFLLAQIGYFYHGIYLGPRYLLSALPFLLFLTSRGISGLCAFLTGIARRVSMGMSASAAVLGGRAAVGAGLAVLLACNVGYYLPRQIQMYHDFTGLPVAQPVRLAPLIGYHPTNAIVVTDDWFVYNYIFWPLNDPDLRASTIWAFAASKPDRDALRAAFPGRILYGVSISPSGMPIFTPLEP